MYIDTLHEYWYNTNHRTIKMKSDVNPSMYIDFNKENKERPKFKVDDHVRI